MQQLTRFNPRNLNRIQALKLSERLTFDQHGVYEITDSQLDKIAYGQMMDYLQRSFLRTYNWRPTKREAEFCCLVACGYSLTAIGTRLGVTYDRVKALSVQVRSRIVPFMAPQKLQEIDWRVSLALIVNRHLGQLI